MTSEHAVSLAAQFCSACGALSINPGTCHECGTTRNPDTLTQTPITSHSHPFAFQKRKYETSVQGMDSSGQVIQEECPSCGNPEMMYTTAQLRSADEGQTIFYTCPKCRHKLTLNS